jgi:hypothetical protein
MEPVTRRCASVSAAGCQRRRSTGEVHMARTVGRGRRHPGGWCHDLVRLVFAPFLVDHISSLFRPPSCPSCRGARDHAAARLAATRRGAPVRAADRVRGDGGGAPYLLRGVGAPGGVHAAPGAAARPGHHPDDLPAVEGGAGAAPGCARDAWRPTVAAACSRPWRLTAPLLTAPVIVWSRPRLSRHGHWTRTGVS